MSYSEDIDTSSSMGKAIFTIVAEIADLEHSIIREQVTAGVRQAITNRNGASGRLIEAVDPTISTTVVRLKKQGLGCHRIGRKLGLSSRTVWKVLQRREAV
ncbi:MAG: recombinase family protein [Nitrospiraceae bacterium]